MITTHIEVVLIVAPLTAHQFKRSETQVGRTLESSQEHTHEADGREVLDGADLPLIISNRNGELVPGCTLSITVAGVNIGYLLIGDIVCADPH